MGCLCTMSAGSFSQFISFCSSIVVHTSAGTLTENVLWRSASSGLDVTGATPALQTSGSPATSRALSYVGTAEVTAPDDRISDSHFTTVSWLVTDTTSISIFCASVVVYTSIGTFTVNDYGLWISVASDSDVTGAAPAL